MLNIKKYIIFSIVFMAFSTSITFASGFEEKDQSTLRLESITKIHDSADGYPLNPTNIKTLVISDNIYAFIQNNNDIQIINITDLTTPSFIGTIQNMISDDKEIINFDMVTTLYRSYIFVFIEYEKQPFLFPSAFPTPIIIDVTNPDKPREMPVRYIHELFYLGMPYGKAFDVNGRQLVSIMSAYTGGGIRIFDFTDPIRPVLIYDSKDYGKLYSDTIKVTDIDMFEISNHTIAFPHGRYSMLDIDNPDTPIIPNWFIKNSPHHIDVHDVSIINWMEDIYAVVFTNTGSIHTINVTIPTRPILISSIYEDSEDFDSLSLYRSAKTFNISDNIYAIMPVLETDVKDDLIQMNNSIQIINMTNPTSLHSVGNIPYNYVNDIEIVEFDDNVYVLISGKQFSEHGWEYINIVKITDDAETIKDDDNNNIR